MQEYQKLSKDNFGDHCALSEYYFTEIIKKLTPLKPIILSAIKSKVINKEQDYWMYKNIDLFNIIVNISDDGVLSCHY